MVALSLDPVRNLADHSYLRSRAHPIETECQLILRKCNEHSLEDQRRIDLLNRFDIKFVLPVTILPELLQRFATTHTVLKDSGHGVFTYENTYFDTPLWNLYKQHHNGKLNRFKYRHRHYLETDIAFLEIKQKTNKRRTLKRRIPWRCTHPIDLPNVNFSLEAKLYINYRRITLWHHETGERLTLDFDILYQRLASKKKVEMPSIMIAEVKHANYAKSSAFVKEMKVLRYYPQSISKYCLGVCLTDDGCLKYNRFKRLMSKLKQYSTP